MCIVYGLNYLDKTTLSYASVMGLRLPPSADKLHSGINLKGDHYQWLGSMFYFGYIAFEYPTTRLLQALPLGKYCMLPPLLPLTRALINCSCLQHHHVGSSAIMLRRC
jgi:ACS family allantoate permease-like MFS transporter